MSKVQPNEASVTADVQPLLVKVPEVCRMLGGIHPRTLLRMERSGAVRSVRLLRHKLYAVSDIINLVEGLREWKP